MVGWGGLWVLGGGGGCQVSKGVRSLTHASLRPPAPARPHPKPTWCAAITSTVHCPRPFPPTQSQSALPAFALDSLFPPPPPQSSAHRATHPCSTGDGGLWDRRQGRKAPGLVPGAGGGRRGPRDHTVLQGSPKGHAPAGQGGEGGALGRQGLGQGLEGARGQLLRCTTSGCVHVCGGGGGGGWGHRCFFLGSKECAQQAGVCMWLLLLLLLLLLCCFC